MAVVAKTILTVNSPEDLPSVGTITSMEENNVCLRNVVLAKNANISWMNESISQRLNILTAFVPDTQQYFGHTSRR